MPFQPTFDLDSTHQYFATALKLCDVDLQREILRALSVAEIEGAGAAVPIIECLIQRNRSDEEPGKILRALCINLRSLCRMQTLGSPASIDCIWGGKANGRSREIEIPKNVVHSISEEIKAQILRLRDAAKPCVNCGVENNTIVGSSQIIRKGMEGLAYQKLYLDYTLIAIKLRGVLRDLSREGWLEVLNSVTARMLTDQEASVPVLQCRSCGLLYLGAKISSKRISSFYQNAEYHGVHKLPGGAWINGSADQFSIVYRKGLLPNWLKRNDFLHEGDLVLDIGCGYGVMLKHCEMLGASGVGVDLDQSRLNYASLVLGLPNLMDASEVALGDSGQPQFDLVFSNHALEHIEKPLNALHCMVRILKPGGYLVVAVPNGNLAYRKSNAEGWPEVGFKALGGDHLHAFTEVCLTSWMEHLGLALQSVQKGNGRRGKGSHADEACDIVTNLPIWNDVFDGMVIVARKK